MSKHLIIIIGAGVFQLPAIIKAKSLGYFVVALDGKEDAEGFSFADQSFVADIKDANACLAIIKDMNPVAIVSMATEIAVVTVAKLCEHFGLPGLSVEAALNSTNKQRMRKCFEQKSLPSPVSFSITQADAKETATKIGLPVVVKPTDSAGSRGVSIVTTYDQLLKAYHHAKSNSPSGEVLIEEYMDGVEISVEAFVQNGEVSILALSDKIRTPFPYPLDTRVIFPSNKDAWIQEEAKRIAKEAILSCDIQTAVIHIEMMVTATGPKLVELAARGAGFHVYSTLLGWVCGIDTSELLIDLALGRKVVISNLCQRGAVLSFPNGSKGKIVKIEGVADLELMKELYEFRLYVKEGDIIRELQSGSDRIGHIIVLADDRKQAIEAADKAEQKLIILTKE